MSQPKTIEPSMLNFFVQNPEAPFWESTETEELDVSLSSPLAPRLSH